MEDGFRAGAAGEAYDVTNGVVWCAGWVVGRSEFYRQAGRGGAAVVAAVNDEVTV